MDSIGGAETGLRGGGSLHPGTSRANNYCCYAQSVAANTDTDVLNERTFFERYVRPRQPVLLLGQCATVLHNSNILQQLNLQTLAKLVATSSSSSSSTNTVEVNIRAAASASASSSETSSVTLEKEENRSNKVSETVGIAPPPSASLSFSPLHGSVVMEMPFDQLCDALQSKNTDYYMTTQTLPTDDEGRPSVVTWLSELLIQHHYLPLRPKLLGHLIPMNAANVWMGCASSVASSSGLHHDFHDNLYCLIRGCKTIRIAPPHSIHQFTKMVGRLHTRHDNGRMVYHEQLSNGTSCSNGRDLAVSLPNANATAATMCPIRPDGADVTVERIMQLEIRKEDIERELESTGAAATLERQNQLNAELDQIEEELLDIEMLNPHPPNNDESGSPDDSTEDDEDDDEVFFGTRINNALNQQQQLEKQPPSSKHKRAKVSHPNHYDITHCHDTADKNDDWKTAASDATVANHPRILVPPNFVLEEGSNNEDDNSKVQFQTIHMQAGDVLYLPAGWFHEVYSHSAVTATATTRITSEPSASAANKTSTTTTASAIEPNDDDNDGIHMAVNYWVHPPDIGTDFERPYLSAFWQRDWDARGYDTK